MRTFSYRGTLPQTSAIIIAPRTIYKHTESAFCKFLRFPTPHFDRKRHHPKEQIQESGTPKCTGNHVSNIFERDTAIQGKCSIPVQAESYHHSPRNNLPTLCFPARQTKSGLEKMFKDLSFKIKNARNYTQMYEYTKAYFKKALSHTRVKNNYLLFNALNLVAECPTNTMEEICTELRVSGRQLRRVFNKNLGVNPKTCLRLSRLHKAAALAITADEIDFHQLIDQCGYYDQSHFGRDIRLLTGKTPVEFFRKQADSSSGQRIQSSDHLYKMEELR